MVEIANKSCFFYNFSAKYRLLSLGVKEEMPDTMVTMVEMSDTMVTMAEMLDTMVTMVEILDTMVTMAEMPDTMVTMVEMPDTMVRARPRRKVVEIQSVVVSSIAGLLTLT